MKIPPLRNADFSLAAADLVQLAGVPRDLHGLLHLLGRALDACKVYSAAHRVEATASCGSGGSERLESFGDASEPEAAATVGAELQIKGVAGAAGAGRGGSGGGGEGRLTRCSS